MPTKPDKLQNRETERKYVKFKMKRIKKAKKRGNTAEGERHANELLQFLGLDGASEVPIEGIIAMLEGEETGVQQDGKFEQLRDGVHSEWF